MHFPLWFILGMILVFFLPATSLVLIGLGVGWFISRRKGRKGAAKGFRWSVVAIAPFWLVGAGFGTWLVSEQLSEQAHWARNHYTLHTATVIDGVSIPAGTMVSRDDDGTLRAVDLPEGTTLTAGGATWRGHLEFSSPVNEPRGQISAGTLATAAVIQGIPCQGDKAVDFLSRDELMTCTLSRDTPIDATIKNAAGINRSQRFVCQGGASIEFQPVSHSELASCVLATPAEIGDVACAGDAKFRLANGTLDSCTLAKETRFGPVTLPPGTTVTYYGAQPSGFKLPPTGSAVDAFGLSLPSGTEASFCYRSKGLERLEVNETAYVTIGGLKLTGSIGFDCGPFHSGPLFEDTVISGQRRQRGELVSQEDLSLK